MSTTTPPWKILEGPSKAQDSAPSIGDIEGYKTIPRMDLTCPECGHVQSEPVRVVATQCRSCLKHYQVRDGQVVARVRPRARLAKPGASDEVTRPEPERAPLPSPPRKPVSPPMAWWKRMILRPQPPREVKCFDCDRQFTAGGEAESTQCPSCGAYVSLRSHEIREAWTRELRTCGDVVIHREGSVRQTRIQCHHLTVYGRISGQIDCSGSIVIHSGGKISGAVRCKRFHVRRKAKVEFNETVFADEILIEGEARGVFHCSGTITLARRALLQGLVRASSLNVRSGASHIGTVEIIEPEQRVDAQLTHSK